MTWLRRCPVFLAIAAAALAACVPEAQARLPRGFDTRPMSEQTHLFRAVLYECGIRPVTDGQALLDDPSSKMLIVLGANDVIDREWPGDQLQQFLAGGGSLLLASDQATSPHLSSQIGAVIAGGFFQSPPHESYRGTLTECPLLRRHRPRADGHALFHDLPASAVIATNRPSRITDWWPPVKPIAYAHGGGLFRDFVRGQFRQYNGQSVIAVVAERDSGSRLLVISDHSIFINGMMQQPDNDNYRFAYSAVQWLSENGRRKEALFHDGQLQNDFSIMHAPPLPPILPPIEAALPRINELIRDLGRENTINRAILEHVSHDAILRAAALVLTLGTMTLGIVRFLGSRRRFAARSAAKSKAPGAPASEPRVGDAGRELARQLYGELGRWDPGTASPPVIAVRGSARLRRDWARRHAALWSAAAGHSTPGSAAELRRLHAEALELRAAVGAGVVQFPPEP